MHFVISCLDGLRSSCNRQHSPLDMWLQLAACVLFAAHAGVQLRRVAKTKADLQRSEVSGLPTGCAVLPSSGGAAAPAPAAAAAAGETAHRGDLPMAVTLCRKRLGSQQKKGGLSEQAESRQRCGQLDGSIVCARLALLLAASPLV